MTNLLRGIGVRGRLLLAFFAISAFAVLATAAALFAFADMGSVVVRLSREQVPAGFAALELSRQAERIAAVAPKLLNDRTSSDALRTDRMIRREIANLEKLLIEVKAGHQNRPFISDIEQSVTEIRLNLSELQIIRDLGPEMRGDWIILLPGEMLTRGQKFLQKNGEASTRLATAVNRFIDNERAEIAKARGRSWLLSGGVQPCSWAWWR